MTLKKLSLKSKANPSRKILLAVGAHPDDIDIGCSGTVAKYISEGHEVFYLILTDGSKGSEDTNISNRELIKTRQEEQQKAADILGVSKVFFLDFIDGELQNTSKLRRQIVKIIRQLNPHTVICWDPTFYYDTKRQFVNHPDHRVAGEATMDCVYPYARNARTFPELLKEGLEPHVVEELLLFNFGKANYFVDISKTIEKKIGALSCHRSQFRDIEKFAARIKEMAKQAGQQSKPEYKYAEGFVHLTLRQPS